VKITALEVDGFGIWSGLRLDPLSDGLSVFFGPNEAGKTTLMQFVRSVLYGFSAERRRYLPPVHGGRPGGTLYLLSPDGRYVVRRHADPAGGAGGAGGATAEHVEVLAPDGSSHGEPLLEAVLCRVGEPVFNNVFAVGLNEVQELATLNDTEAARLLYRLTIGMDQVSLVDVMRQLDSSRNRLLDRSGGPCQVLQLLGQRDQLRGEIRELDELGRRHGRLTAEWEQAGRESARLEGESRELSAQLRTVEIGLAVRPRWQERTLLDDQLAALGPTPAIPPGAGRRLERIQASLEKRQEALDELELRREEIRRERAELEVNDALWRQGPRIEALGEQEAWMDSLAGRVVELENEMAGARSQLERHAQRLGIGRGPIPSISPQSLAALRRPAAELRRCRRDLDEVRRRVESSHETAQSLDDEIQSALESRGERQLTEATDRVGALVEQLRRRIQIDERLDEIDRHLAELGQRSQGLMDRQMLPAGVLLGLGGVFVAGAVLVMLAAVGLLASSALLGRLGWPAALVGLAAAGGAVIAKLMLERSDARKADACQRQIRMLQLQRKQAKEERATLDRQLPPGEGSLQARLQEAERELAGLEDLVPLDARRHAARGEADSAADQVRQAEEEMAAAVRRWKEAIAAAGLPKGLRPKQVKHLASGRDQRRQIELRLERSGEDLARRRAELEALHARIAQVAGEAGMTLDGRSPVEQLHALAEAAARQRVRVERRQTLREQWRGLRRQRARHQAGLARLTGRRRRILERVGVKDPEEFRQLAARHAHAADLRSRQESLHREIEAVTAGHCPVEALAELLDVGPAHDLEARRDQLRALLDACAAQLRQRLEDRGRLGEQLKVLADNRTGAQKQLDLGMIEKRLADAVSRWKVLALASEVLEAVRKNYEQTRQPETLQEASGYFAQMTGGRYRRVWTPLSDDVLVIDDAQGKPCPVEILSRGVREQLFLCLRLALATCYARRGVALPMILDDVLVNFDGQRAKAAVDVLRGLAAGGHQLLVFTCHEHIAKLFQAIDVEVHDLADGSAPPLAITPAQKPAKARRRRGGSPEELPREAAGPPEERQPTVAPPSPAAPPKEEPSPPREVAAEPMERLAPWEEDPAEKAMAEDETLGVIGYPTYGGSEAA